MRSGAGGESSVPVVAGLGTVVNVVAIVAGTAAGLLVGRRFPDRVRTTVVQGIGIAVVAMGVADSLETDNLVFPVVAIVLGGILGELAGIEERFEALGQWLRRRVHRRADPEIEGVAPGPGPVDAPSAEGGRPPFVEGFVSASLLFCVGPLAILGSIDDGLTGDIRILSVKAALDGLISVIFASTLGWGVAFSALPVAAYQGSVTALAGLADRFLTDRMITELTATGGLIVIGLGLRLLDIKQVRVGSFLPALALAPLLVALFAT